VTNTRYSLARRRFLKALGLGACSLVLPGSMSAQGRTKQTQRPNIVFIFSDDLSYRDLNCYGQKQFRTPNLDELAMNGIRFTNAYCGSPECAPPRVSLMTGTHIGHCRIRANRSVRGQDHLLAEGITIAEVLKQAGYSTSFIGKWGIGLPGTEGTPDKQGFDYSYGDYDQRTSRANCWRNASEIASASGVSSERLMRNASHKNRRRQRTQQIVVIRTRS